MSELESNGSPKTKRKSLEDIDWDNDSSNRTRAQARDYTPEYDPPPRRRPAGARDAAFNYLAWIVEGATGLVEEVRHNDLGLSEEFWVHFYAARREGLLAVRALLDALIEGDAAEAQRQSEREKRRARRGSVDIEF